MTTTACFAITSRGRACRRPASHGFITCSVHRCQEPRAVSLPVPVPPALITTLLGNRIQVPDAVIVEMAVDHGYRGIVGLNLVTYNLISDDDGAIIGWVEETQAELVRPYVMATVQFMSVCEPS